MGIGSEVSTEGHPLTVNKAQLLDIGRTEAVSIQTGLDGCEALGELDVQAISVWSPEHQQPRAPVAKGYAGYVNAILEEIRRRCQSHLRYAPANMVDLASSVIVPSISTATAPSCPPTTSQ